MYMEEKKSLKQEVGGLMAIKGKSRGDILRNHFSYIKLKEGEEGIKVLEAKMNELGYPIIFDSIKPFDWYPEAMGVAILLVAKDIFGWNDEDIFNMGKSEPKQSTILKFLIKYLISIEKAFGDSSPYWKKHYDFGDFTSNEINLDKKYCSFRISGYKFHPIVCTFWKGYFLEVGSFVINGKDLTIEETACVFKGDAFHEFMIRWK
jgi:hypothetical protein